MIINWKQYKTYKDACDCTGVIYLHEWDGKPFYWGKADKSFFGGGSRKHEAGKRTGRYNSGYKHWIEGCLQHGAKLYIGELSSEDVSWIDDIERQLIATYPSTMAQRTYPFRQIELIHEGDVPDSILISKSPLIVTGWK
ncbi:hypothetical protein [Spirosoma sp. KUDC1026]|uniref:hypothetical protein n=1 Tax=Spirosoma sp. KUDC1026 TaxID=2745947 RepID=UPI00159BB05A|nr:hypothetical protein [Spirosoma sp. KUDC1026]QKZ12666.1 hypothetical protein HU175_08475 [Spirosoma sp. KUDC1026]